VPPAEEGTAVNVTLPPVQIDWPVPLIETDNWEKTCPKNTDKEIVSNFGIVIIFIYKFN
jgi:hypothetical protein